MTRRSTGTLTAQAARQSKKTSSTIHAKTKVASKTEVGKSHNDTADTTADPHQEADALLKEDHRKVEQLFKTYTAAQDLAEKKKISDQICLELIVHTELEEELFYPACRAGGVVDNLLDEAQVEHDGAKVLITQLITLEADSDYYDAKVKVLAEYIKHHVGEEEKPADGIFAKARTAGVDMVALARQIQSRKEEILAQGEDQILQPPIPCSLQTPDFINLIFKENQTMANQQNRDDQGRFTNEGQRSSSGGRYQSRDDYGDDNDGRSRSGSSSQYGNRSSYDDDNSDDRYNRGGSQRQSQGQGQGQGWHGDSEGHSQAARRGRSGSNDDQGNYGSGSSGNYGSGSSGNYGSGSSGNYGSGSSGNYGSGSSGNYGNRDDQSRGHQSSGRYDQGNDRDDHRSSGNYGSRNDQSRGRQSSSRYDQDDNRSSRGYGDRDEHGSGSGRTGGWFGDSEGHAEAARRGHQSSGSPSRNERNDSNDHSGHDQHQGHGGWFGDPSGHADAARRGWDNR